jgi:hypothetical protein
VDFLKEQVDLEDAGPVEGEEKPAPEPKHALKSIENDPDQEREEALPPARRFFSLLFERRTLSILLLSMALLTLIGIGTKALHPWLNRAESLPKSVSKDAAQESLLRDEMIAPFFIPLPEGSTYLAVRLDVIARWDGTDRARFQTNAAQIRMEIYRYLLGHASQNPDFKGQVASLEKEVSHRVRKMLGSKEVQFLFDKVTYF